MKTIITLLVLFMVSGCEDSYRYPCQDPVNWKDPKCEPPPCLADETCTKFLIEVPNEN
jgi:hypothetical protein